MTKLLVRWFIKDHENISSLKVRENYGVLGGAVGIFCNMLLCILKFILGVVTHSVSITADAANNLSDASSSIVSLVGAKAANKPADDEHPFGHGRLEYICALIVSFIILVMGFELMKSSVSKIIHPEAVVFNLPALIALLLSILVKLWMAYFNHTLGKKINSPTMTAVVSDSLNDCLTTGATIVVLVAAAFTKLPLDGYIGVIVALFILWAGVSLLRKIITPLLGQAPDPELIHQIQDMILSYDGVVGVHDLIIHDYGPNRIIASAHAEVPSNIDIMTSHDTIDLIEKRINQELNVMMVIHMDPIIVDDERINALHQEVINLVHQIDARLTIHDFRVVDGPTHTNLIFDLVTPHHFSTESHELIREVSEKLQKINPSYFAVITVECSYAPMPEEE